MKPSDSGAGDVKGPCPAHLAEIRTRHRHVNVLLRAASPRLFPDVCKSTLSPVMGGYRLLLVLQRALHLHNRAG